MSTYPPVHISDFQWPVPTFPEWPQVAWKDAMLRLNYGDAASDPDRVDKVNAVILVVLPSGLVKEVPNRRGAVVVSDMDYAHKKSEYIMKEAIVKIVKLF